MSDFISSNLHKKVDHLMDIFFGAGVASHPTIIEQINYLLFMRALSQKDDDLKKIGVTDSDKIVFDGELEKYHWDNLLTLNAEQLFIALEECFRKIPESTTNRTVRLVFRNAHIKLFDKPSLRTVVHELDAFAKLMDEEEHEGKRDIFGDTYEYLLSKLSQAGTSGQFRTPRHIIEFLVAVVEPKKGETILDPAVGTAGFLVKAFEYLRHEYTSPEQLASGGAFDKLSSKEHSFLYEHTFSGFDSDEDMIKFGMMNLYLHGLQNAKLVRQNTLTDTAGSRDKYDVILANPPFSGKIDRDSVAEELQTNTGATEVLFLRYMMRHLTDNGRAGVIVPEGVLFNASGGYTKIRELLLENGLWCVVSLPGGVFNPYAGVKTSILFFDKSRKENAEVLFAKVENDGFSLSSQRKVIAKNDLPEILEDIQRYKKGEELQLLNAHVVAYERINKTKDFNLNGDRYKLILSSSAQKYGSARLGDIFEIVSTKWTPGQDFKSYIGLEDIEGHTGKLLSIQSSPPKSTKTRFKSGDILIGRLRPNLNKVWLSTIDDSICSTDFVALRSIDTNVALAEFFASILMSSEVNRVIVNGVSGANLPRVSSSYLMDIKVPLPPVEAQRRIVQEIHNKQEAINHAHEIIKVLEKERAYFDPSTRANEEGWPAIKLRDLLVIERGASPRPIDKFMTTDQDGENWVKIGDTKNATKYITSVAEKITKDGAARSRRVDPGDFILSNSMSFGRPYIMKISGYIHDGWLLLKNNDKTKLDNDYLYEILSCGYVQRQFESSATGGVVRNLNSALVREVTIPLPPIEIQKEIAAEFTEEQRLIDANLSLISLYKKKIAHVIAEV